MIDPGSDIPAQHRHDAPSSVRCAVITVSDTRTPENDTGGNTLAARLISAGHTIPERRIIPDEPGPMRELLEELAQCEHVDAILMTGGTGVSGRDQTYETVTALLTKPMPGYGELLRMLSYDQIGPAAMLSRAAGGLIGRTLVLTMPGSRAAVELALEKLILPELGHMIREARR